MEPFGTSIQVRDRILDAFMWQTTDETLAEGLDWYNRTAAEARRLASGDVAMGAGVIAALSPLAPWGLNLQRARLAFERGDANGLTFGAHTRKANRIMAGEDPDDVLSGPKVRSFYECIMGSTTAVCVDRHAIAIVMGRPLNDKERKVLDRKGAYDHIANGYRDAASMVGLVPSQLQAVTWVSWRKQHGLDWADNERIN